MHWTAFLATPFNNYIPLGTLLSIGSNCGAGAFTIPSTVTATSIKNAGIEKWTWGNLVVARAEEI